MAAKEYFFKEDKPHGLAKRLIYKKYLQAYIPIMLPKNKPENKLTILDGFAGKGRYEEYGWPQEIEKYGSPIIAVHVAVQHILEKTFEPDQPSVEMYEIEIKEQYGPELIMLQKSAGENITPANTDEHSLMLIFVEHDRKNFQELFINIIKTLRIYKLKVDVKASFQQGFCKIYLDDAESVRMPAKYRIACALYCTEFQNMQAPSAPSLVLLDPYGFNQTPWNRVKDCIGFGKEVFINFMSSYVNRFITQKPRQVQDLFGFPVQSKLFKNLSDEEPDDEQEDKILELVETYQQRLRTLPYASHTVNFEMRGTNNARIYHLVFVTNHVKGLEVMKESMNRGTQEANKFCFSDFQIIKKNKPISFRNDQRDEDVAEVILETFGGQQVNISNIKHFILFDTLYVFRKKPLALLEEAGKMKVAEGSRPGGLQRRRNQYPDDTDWMLKFVRDFDEEPSDLNAV